MTAIVIDTETTGLIEPQLIEVAWSKINSPVDLDAFGWFSQRYAPTKRIELGAMSTHHIMDEDLVNCPMHFHFSLPVDISYLIGHNIDYDWSVISKPDIKRICTLALSRYLWPELDSHKQSAMIYHLEREKARELLKNVHNATCDVYNCIVLLGHIITKLGDITSWEQLWEVSEKARVPIKFHFGKHRGELIEDTPVSYRQWMLKQPDIDPYLREALEK